MEENKTLIIYHKADNDGLFSASIYYDYLKRNTSEEGIYLFPADYEDLKTIEGQIEQYCNQFGKIVMLDISFNNPVIMEYLYQNKGEDFIWFDHHAPIINESKIRGFDKAKGHRSTECATILNVFNYLYDGIYEEPLLFKILDAFDNWYYQNLTLYVDGKLLTNDDYISINAAVNNRYKLHFNAIYELVSQIIDGYEKNENTNYDNEIIELIKEGHICMEYDKNIFTNSIKTYGDFEFTINGRKAIFIVMSRQSSAIYFKEFANSHTNAIVAKYTPNGNWVLSVYNTKKEYDNEFDVGSYLKENYGGGGHKGAGGCTLTNEVFQKIIRDKKL